MPQMKNYLYLFVLPVTLGAQPLAALVDEALLHNREVLAAQKKYEAARQKPSQENSLPDPTVSLGYTANGAPYPVAGIGRDVTSNAGIMISQELPFPGKRQLRGEIASKEASAEYEQYLAVRLSVTARLKQAYHELHHANAGITFVHRYQELLQNILRISEVRYSVGRAAQQDVFKAQTQFAIFQTQLLRYEQERDSKQIEIDALLNRPQGGRIVAPEDIALGELPATLEDLLAHARTHAPTLAREQKMVERNDLASALARRNLYPITPSRAATSIRARCRPCGSSAWISSCRRTSAPSRTPRSRRRPSPPPKRATTTRPRTSPSNRRSARHTP